MRLIDNLKKYPIISDSTGNTVYLRTIEQQACLDSFDDFIRAMICDKYVLFRAPEEESLRYNRHMRRQIILQYMLSRRN